MSRARPENNVAAVVLLVCLSGLLPALPASAQSTGTGLAPGDTVHTLERSVLWKSPAAVAFTSTVSPRTLLVVEEVREGMVAVSSGDERGWVRKGAFEAGRSDRRSGSVRISEPPPLASRPTWRFPGGVTRATASVDRLVVYRSRTGGLSASVLLSNVSRFRTVKYAVLTLELRRPTGDSLSRAPVAPRRTVRAVGPLAPGKTASYDFRDVWRHPSDACVTIRRFEVIHLDGSVFVRRGRRHAETARRPTSFPELRCVPQARTRH